MFLHLSVILFIGKGVYPSMHLGRHYLGQTYPSMHWRRHNPPPLGRHIPACTGADPLVRHPTMHWGRHPPWADISQDALGQTPPLGRHIPVCTGAVTPQADTPPSRHIPSCTRADTPPGQMATAADGTHPTGMHSCCFNVVVMILPWPSIWIVEKV